MRTAQFAKFLRRPNAPYAALDVGGGAAVESMHAAPRANEQQTNNRRSLLAALRKGAPPLAGDERQK